MVEYKHLLFIGISFLLASLIQLTIFYYQNTLEPVPIFLPLIITISIITAIVILDIFIEDSIKKNKAAYCMFIIFTTSILLALSVLTFQTPKAVITYSYKCPEFLQQGIELTFQNSGRIYGEINPLVTSHKNVTVNYNGLRLTQFRVNPFIIQPQPYTINLMVNYSKYGKLFKI